MVVTRDEFLEWKQLPVTRKLMEQISKDVETMKFMLVSVSQEDLPSLQGRCTASINMLGVEYEDLFEEVF